MPKQFRRFEMLLPTLFNTGAQVPEDAFAQTLSELESQFGALSSETQTIQGWHHEGERYRDQLFRLFVDVPDTAENRQFFVDFKERLKQRFQQYDIWMTSWPLEVI